MWSLKIANVAAELIRNHFAPTKQTILEKTYSLKIGFCHCFIQVM
jgi:hypothetical protein